MRMCGEQMTLWGLGFGWVVGISIILTGIIKRSPRFLILGATIQIIVAVMMTFQIPEYAVGFNTLAMFMLVLVAVWTIIQSERKEQDRRKAVILTEVIKWAEDVVACSVDKGIFSVQRSIVRGGARRFINGIVADLKSYRHLRGRVAYIQTMLPAATNDTQISHEVQLIKLRLRAQIRLILLDERRQNASMEPKLANTMSMVNEGLYGSATVVIERAATYLTPIAGWIR